MELDERYSRQIMLSQLGEAGQKRIGSSSVLIVGLGGLGAPVATYLVGAGVGRVGLCDSDVVSLSNLQRQVLYETEMIGLKKAECAYKRLSALSPETEFDIIPQGLNEDNAEKLIADFDIVVDCCDNFATRYLIDDVCASLGKKWVYGAVGDFKGQLSVMNACGGHKYRDWFPEDDITPERPEVAGVIGPLPGVIGAMQAAEILKVIAGIGETLEGKLFVFDLLNFDTFLISR